MFTDIILQCAICTISARCVGFVAVTACESSIPIELFTFAIAFKQRVYAF